MRRPESDGEEQQANSSAELNFENKIAIARWLDADNGYISTSIDPKAVDKK
ncbi:MAG: hypothetical protein U0Z26_15435 [Anaerolineales bacterium]